ncbi:MAG: hypothetical protein SFU21_05155, partial [Flavihumibacter sp.]|nr:hypothetical protein [Flavihumibacter sp.]
YFLVVSAAALVVSAAAGAAVSTAGAAVVSTVGAAETVSAAALSPPPLLQAVNKAPIAKTKRSFFIFFLFNFFEINGL